MARLTDFHRQQRLLDLRDWCRMALEKFDGTGAPIEATDWISSVVDKLESFCFRLGSLCSSVAEG
jgi:hypothetical protein